MPTSNDQLILELRETLAWNELILSNLKESVFVVDAQGVILYLNQAAADLLKTNAVVMLGKNITNITQDQQSALATNLQMSLPFTQESAGSLSGEYQLKSDQKNYVVEITAAFLEKLNQVVLVLRDITQIQAQQKDLFLSEQLLRSILESVPVAITYSDESGHFSIYNKTMASLTGYSIDEANKTHEFHKLLHPDEDASVTLNHLHEIIPNQTLTTESSIKTKQGFNRFLNISTTKIQDHDKVMFLSVYQDLTAQKKTQERLRNFNAELQSEVLIKTHQLDQKIKEIAAIAKFPEENPQPIFRIAPDGAVLYVNPAGNVLVERGIIGTSINNSDWKTTVSQVLSENTIKIFEIEFEHQIYESTFRPLPDGPYVNIYMRNITKEKQVDRMKSEFISLASHQLRTPLTAIRWFSDYLLNPQTGSLNADQLELATDINSATKRLIRLVNDLLNVSRLETGRITIQPEMTNIDNLIIEINKELGSQYQSKQLQLTFKSGDLPLIPLDSLLTRQVILNLLTNAIKYTPANGQITIRTIIDEQQKIYSLEVEDSGMGIPQSEQSRIFERFFRAANAQKVEDNESTGLGLYLIKVILEASGCAISFTSEENKGTTFKVTIPFTGMKANTGEVSLLADK